MPLHPHHSSVIITQTCMSLCPPPAPPPQTMQWCAQQRLHERSTTGRYASMPEWHRRVQARRERRQAQAAGSTLFLDDTLSRLCIAGAYPFSSLQNAVFMLFVTIKEVDAAAFHAKLSLLLYYLMDVGHVGGPGGAGVDAFRLSLRLPLHVVAVWQARYLLDCADPLVPERAPLPLPAGGAAGEDSSLARACQLLTCSVSCQVGTEVGRGGAGVCEGYIRICVSVERGGGSEWEV